MVRRGGSGAARAWWWRAGRERSPAAAATETKCKYLTNAVPSGVFAFKDGDRPVAPAARRGTQLVYPAVREAAGGARRLLHGGALAPASALTLALAQSLLYSVTNSASSSASTLTPTRRTGT